MSVRWIVVLVCWVSALLLSGAARGGIGEERWYTLRLQGERAGHARTFTLAGEGGVIRSGSVMELRIKRGATEVAMSLESVWEETAAGEPVKLETVSAVGAQPVRKVYRFDAEGVELTVEQAGERRVQRLARPVGKGEGWMPAAAAARAVRAALERGEKRIVVRTVEESFGGGLTVVESVREVKERGEVEAEGRKVAGVRWVVRMDLFPDAESEEWVDETGRLVRGTVNLGAIKLEQVLADRAAALERVAGPELLVSMMVKPTGKRMEGEGSREGRYVVRVKGEGGALPDLPVGAGQRVERIDGRSARVMVRAAGWGDETAGPVAADREASTLIDSTDARVRALGERVRQDEPAKLAEGLRRLVHGYVKSKGLDVGFASASEVARTGSGDCSEHAVLLAALLRSRGVPARVVSGLVYADEFAGERKVFAYHLWTRAWIEGAGGVGADGVKGGRWVDLDATRGGAAAFSGGHIALSESALSDGEGAAGGDDALRLTGLLGRLEISVEESE
jgi:hypothetical protein